MNEVFNKCKGFEWDQGNFLKNWFSHKVSQGECEQVFFNQPLVVHEDLNHSKNEERWFLLGKSDLGRFLCIVFTIRKNLIRVISARDMNKKERTIYNEQV